MFDFSTVKDFDKHIDLSVPNYSGMIDIFYALALEYMPPKGTCIDLGCSTGSFLSLLSSSIEGNYIGVDAVDFSDRLDGFIFEQAKLEEYVLSIGDADLIISFFMLQFLGTIKRKIVIDQLKILVDRGCVLFVAEKVYFKSTKIHAVLTREHYRKKRKGFSDSDILDKDFDLLGSMFSLTDEEMMEELNFLGRYEQVWQSHNFRGWVIYK